MGSSDLNLKKSWHPSTFKNQERVWKEEQKRKEEDRKLEQLKKELAEERQLQELQRMQEDAGTKQKSNKLDWMYAGPNANINGSNDNSMEEFLLGKKNVDELLRAKQREEVQAATNLEESRFTLSNSNANTERDIQAKIREDPLLMIKQREQMALKAIVENPMRLKELKKKEKKDKKKKRDRSKDRHHHHSSNVSDSRHRKERDHERVEKRSRDYNREEKRSRDYDKEERKSREYRRDNRRDDSRDRYYSSNRRSISPRRR
ncbi:hypothetical protein G6F37_003116 [Rhizopus arrhizus]|nr:hypothetical protein G6F38_002860 [Rhizopus arrhizus]KAG1161401.1 hypothetical protein G6F37_003116 [Rhizopus arrhizus]